MATKGATAKVTDWTLPGAACPGLVELLGIDTEQAAREAHRLEDAGVWRGLPPGVYLEDLPPEYRSAIETLMDAEAALRNVEDAVRTYRECYSPATLRRFPGTPPISATTSTNSSPWLAARSPRCAKARRA